MCSLAAQALAWWWVQYGDSAAHELREGIELERSCAPRIHRILGGEIKLRPGLHKVYRRVDGTGMHI
ncbi:MAG: hypothetical protein RSD57_14725 [Comamonas sp.]